MKESILTLKLEKSSMGFKLSDGTVLLIHEDDIKSIANKVLMDVMIDIENPNIILRHDTDMNLERVKKIQEILNSSKDIGEELRQSYYEQMLTLLKETGEIKHNDKRLFEQKKP